MNTLIALPLSKSIRNFLLEHLDGNK